MEFASVDLSTISDEDLLRKMWQQTEDFTRKKEIRAYMYKLREQRLKDFYASNDSSPPYFLMDNASATFGLKKGTVTSSHGDSLVDQSFESFKTKEIRDSESPTRFGSMAIPTDNSGWQIRASEELSEDGKTHTVHTSATTQGTKDIAGGHTAFAGKNLETQSEHFDGDESNYVHKKGNKSSTVLMEDSVVESDDGRTVTGSTRSTTTSMSSSHVVRQQHQGEDTGRAKKHLSDAVDFGASVFDDDHFSATEKRTVTSTNSSTVRTNTVKSGETTANSTPANERTTPKELSKDPERVREAFRLAQGSGKVIEREETMVNASTRMITETKQLDDGTTVTTRTYEKVAQESSGATPQQDGSVGRSGRLANASSDLIRQEQTNQSSVKTTSTSTQRIAVEVDAAHDSFVRSLRSVSPTGSVRSMRSNATISGRSSVSPDKSQLGARGEQDSKPDYMRSTFTSERKLSNFQEQQTGSSQRSASPRKGSTNTAPASRGPSPVKQSSSTSTTVREQETLTTEEKDLQQVDGKTFRGGAKPPLVRSETYEERCRKILGMSNRPADEETKVESQSNGSIFSTYDNTVTVQQSRSEIREQRKKIEQEIMEMESESVRRRTSDVREDEQDSVLKKPRQSSSKESSPTRKQELSPTRKASIVKEVSPTRKPSVPETPVVRKSPMKDSSPSRKASSQETSPTRKLSTSNKDASPTRKPSAQEIPSARKSPVMESQVRDDSPTRKPSLKEALPTRTVQQPTNSKDVSPTRKPSQTDTSNLRKSPTKDTSPIRKSSFAQESAVSSKDITKTTSETTTKSKATVLVEQKKEGRNISVAEITIMPVMEVSESVRAKPTATRVHEKVLTKQSSDTKFDRRTTSTANSRVITNKSSSDFDVKRRAAEMVQTQGKNRTPATSPDKRRPVVEKPSQEKVKQTNHITVAKIKIESMRKPTQVKSHGEEVVSRTSGKQQTSVPKRLDPETDPESSKDTGISDNSEVEETVESVIEMNVTGTSCCRHSDRKDSAPVYRTTGAARTGKNYTRSSSDNHLRATNVSNRQTSASTSSKTGTTTTSGRKVERPVKHVATKTINLSTKAVTGTTTLSSTLESDHLDNVVIDIQLAKSSREPTPNKLVPIPVSPDTEDFGKPRYPDAVQEPDDEAQNRQARTPRVSNIPIFEEATNEYVGCEITEVEEHEQTTSQQATRITNLDRVTEDDESLLSVTEKVSKFAQEARRLQEPSATEPRTQPARFAARPEYDDLDEHLKSDECLLSVSDKVTKFISTAEEVKKIRTSGLFVPEGEDVPAKVTDGDECLLSVNEKVNRFTSRMGAARTSEGRESVATSQTRPNRLREQEHVDEEELEEAIDDDERTGSMSESVSGKFAPQKSPELVKNAMRSTARHTVVDSTADELVRTSGSSIADRYRTTTMSKQFEKQPTGVAPSTSPITLRSTEAVKKAKEIFEKGQTVQDSRQRDILNRPSIWEDRRSKQQTQQTSQKVNDVKVSDVKLTDIGVYDRKSTRQEHTVVDSVTRKESITEPTMESPKPATTPAGSRRDSGSGVRAPAYIRDTVSSKKDLFEKRISSSKIQVEAVQTAQETDSSASVTSARKHSLKQQPEPSVTSPTNRPATVVDYSKPSYMNHTVASLEHINANQRRDSLDHGVGVHHESTVTRSTTNSAKFGVELKRPDTGNRPTTLALTTTPVPASSGPGPASSKRKTSAGESQPSPTTTPVIEEMFELDALERMLESVTGYEQRRRIRAQIRVVKKLKEQPQQQQSVTGRPTSNTVVTSKSVTSSSSTTVTSGRDNVSTKRKDSSPVRSSVRKQSSSTVMDATDTGIKSQGSPTGIKNQESSVIVTETEVNVERSGKQRQQQETARSTATSTTTSKVASLATDRFGSKTSAQQPAKDDRPIWATSNILKKASENTRTFKSSNVSTSITSGGTSVGRKTPKTTTDCITSSYGVGPTDENGLPLFGIRALKKKAAPAPAELNGSNDTDGHNTISGTIVTETMYSENGGPAVGKRSTTHYSNEPGALSGLLDNGERNGDARSKTYDVNTSGRRPGSGLMAIRKTETIDAAGTRTEELEMLDGPEEVAARHEAKVVRKGSVKELTERFIHRESTGSLTQESTRTYPKAGLILRSSAHSQSSRASTPATDGCSVQSGSVDEFDQEHEQTELRSATSSRQVRSFLNDTSKVVDVRDVLQRMSNADNVHEQGDSAEDQEARALLNKFLGASVLMSGVESMVSSTASVLSEPASAPTTKKVSKVSTTTSTTKTQTVKSSGAAPKQVTLDNLDDNWDEAVLKQLLESTTNYEDRRKIRARIRQIMAEKEACADIVAIVTADLQRERHLQQQSMAAAGSSRPSATSTAVNGLPQGESLLLPLLQGLLLSNAAASGSVAGPVVAGTTTVAMPPVEDSGTESGEDLRLLAAAGLQDVNSGGGSGMPTAGAVGGLSGLLSEVAAALDRLQVTLRGEPSTGSAEVMQLDAEQRRGLLALVTRLQQGLLQPDILGAEPGLGDRRRSEVLDASQGRARAGSSRFSAKRRTNRNNRHTVGVSREELADARRFIEEMVLMDSRQQSEGGVPAPEKAYLLQKQHSLGTVLGPAAEPTPEPPTPTPAFAMKRPSQFVPKEMQNGQTSLDKLSLPKPGPAPVVKPLKERGVLLRQSVSVDQPDGVATDATSSKPIDLHKHPHKHATKPAPELVPFKKPTQTVAQRALVKKYSFNDGSSSDEDDARRALRKTEEPKKTAEQTVLRNKPGPAGPGSIVVNTVQKIVSRETKVPPNEIVAKAPVTRRLPVQNGRHTPEGAPKEVTEIGGRPLNKYASKKLRMKRANTIDLPKNLPPSDDEEGPRPQVKRPVGSGAKAPGVSSTAPPVEVPDFKPRTENDLKFMAFLQRQNQQTRQVWSNPVREHVGSNNWTNKFGHLKNNFEQADRRDRSDLPPRHGAPRTSAMNFWKQAENGSFDEGARAGPKPHAKSTTPQNQPVGPGPTRSTQSVGRFSSGMSPSSPVVEGKLVLPKAVVANANSSQFSHAAASAFKPIPKKLPPAHLEFKPIQHEPAVVKPIPARVSNATGQVRQIVASGFKETPEIKPEPMHIQLGLVRSLAAQGYQETPYVPLPKLERTPTHNVLNYKPQAESSGSADPAPAAPWVGKKSTDVTGPAGSRVASIAATKFTANSFGHHKPSLPASQPLTYHGSLKYSEKPLTYQLAGSMPHEKRPSLPDVSTAHLGTYTFTDYTQPESVSTFSLNRSDSLTNPENAPLVLTSSNSVFGPTAPQQINYLAVQLDQPRSASHSSANGDDDDEDDEAGVLDYDDLESVDSQEMRVVSKVMQAPQGQQATYTSAPRPTHLNGYDAGGRGSLIAQSLHTSLKKIKDKSPTPPKPLRQHNVPQQVMPSPNRRSLVAPQVEITPAQVVPSHAIYNNVQRLPDQGLARTKSSHNLAVPATVQQPRPISTERQRTVEAYFSGQPAPTRQIHPNPNAGYMMSRTASNQNLMMRDKSGMTAPYGSVRPVSYAMGHNVGYYNGTGHGQPTQMDLHGYGPVGNFQHQQSRHVPSYANGTPTYSQQQPLPGGLLRSRTMPHIPLGSLSLLDENNVEDAFEELMNQSFAV
ncbi:uncharacterized protein LOC128728965 [Anopheles nili]|uniref:uncharacterized protein LOC128728965 n=1 Tax=Anopheles nili TaxID=185578 RepID=UPI00237B15EB|nr:uncharacterized protein LOC128728965 [Anopheles nili]